MAQVMAKALWEGFLTIYRFPTSILSDKGQIFESSLIKEVCELGSIQKISITPYHLQGNGQCKWFNSSLISMIETLWDEDKTHWKDFVLTLVHAFNCMKSNTLNLVPIT